MHCGAVRLKERDVHWKDVRICNGVGRDFGDKFFIILRVSAVMHNAISRTSRSIIVYIRVEVYLW